MEWINGGFTEMEHWKKNLRMPYNAQKLKLPHIIKQLEQ